MPFYLRPHRRGPVWSAILVGAGFFALLCLVRILIFGPGAAFVYGARPALRLAGFGLLASLAGGAVAGLAYWALDSALIRQRLITRCIAGCSCVAVALLAMLSVIRLIDPALLPGLGINGPTALSVTVVALTYGLTVGRAEFEPRPDDEYYLTPTEVASLGAHDRATLKRRPRPGDDHPAG